MIRFKTFFGDLFRAADDRVNDWLEEYPDVEILDTQYQQPDYANHSICIMYEVKVDNTNQEPKTESHGIGF